MNATLFDLLAPTREPNPLRRGYGPGPEGKRCKQCDHMIIKRYAGKYFKCSLRYNTNGPATDHRANWLACSKFKESTPCQQ
jgi:hypothetical protein